MKLEIEYLRVIEMSNPLHCIVFFFFLFFNERAVVVVDNVTIRVINSAGIKLS